ncbi:tetratricopeptide repeat protein [Nodularia chucula]|uniref:tetratricopeptide repeat protein n=1 Tax=Nodularia chucula TaxID=3093667 RepID=UPI0039C663E4
MLRRLCITLSVAILCQLHTSLIAEARQPDKFPANPLEVTTPDPLLPTQQLTLPEMQRLQRDLDELHQEGRAKLQAGDQEGAFAIWNREARLRRYFGDLAELEALSRFGAIAWSRNDGEQVRYITQRLQTIEKQAQKQETVDLELMRSLAQAYQQVRSPRMALQVYQQILNVVQEKQDAAGILQTLKTMGELHLSWFDYPQAAATYEKLLNLTATQSDRTSELTYLQQLAYIYQQDKQLKSAVDVLTRLVEIYQQENQLSQIPQLKLTIGSNYELLAQENPSLLREAFNHYQQAYTIAMRSRQYTRAAEALQKSIPLYRAQGQIEAALQTSQILIETQEKAVNYYGMMQAYDQMGQLYLERREYPQALTAFQRGLELAQQLQHEETYFTQQIEKASQ